MPAAVGREPRRYFFVGAPGLPGDAGFGRGVLPGEAVFGFDGIPGLGFAGFGAGLLGSAGREGLFGLVIIFLRIST
jgi:hypothetical protein